MPVGALQNSFVVAVVVDAVKGTESILQTRTPAFVAAIDHSHTSTQEST
jgi:hypothetical protein